MAQEDRKCSSGSGGGAGGSGGGGGVGGSVGSASRSSKKQKQKKPPQRGLGVAQLERLRLEEQQKKDASSLYPPPPPLSPTFNSFCLSASLPNFRLDSEFNPSSSLFRHIPSVPNMDLAAAGPVPLLSARNYREYDPEMRNPLADREVEHCSKLSLPLESHPVLGGHGLIQRVGSDHPPLLVNASSAASMSLHSYQLEPPSNQSHDHGSIAPFTPQGEKMLGGGAKRSCPPAPHFPFKLPKMGNPISRPEEPSLIAMDNVREGPSLSSSMLESSSSESVKENKVSGGEFLTLAPPPLDTPTQPNWHYRQHIASSASRNYCSYPEFEFAQYQGYAEGLGYRHAPGRTDQRPQQPLVQPYYSFLPPMMPLINVENPHANRRSKEPSGSIDLDLKL